MQPADHKRKIPWVRWIGTIIALGLVVWLLLRQGWQEIWYAVQQIDASHFALALALMFGSRLSIAGRWYTLLRSAGEKISYADTLKITFAGLFSSNFLPSTVGGDVVRLAGARQKGLGGAVSAASLIVDRLVGMAGMLAISPVGFLKWAATGMVMPGARLGGQYFLAAAVPSGDNLVLRVWHKGMSLIKRVGQAISIWLRQPKALIIALLFTFGHMAFLFATLSLFLTGMGDPIPFWTIAGIWSLVYLITLVPVSINGLGLQEVATVFFFSTLGGAAESSALTLALLSRTFQMLLSLPGALYLSDILPDATIQE
ncbi:MAG: flippase-like domain-containing protein [Anaerolineae bacterium]|nr:flippase-like domain-containing protein [Anaerolineae bacterium]